jgi:hypothetical protein
MRFLIQNHELWNNTGRLIWSLSLFLMVTILLVAGCGYRIARKNVAAPANLDSIAILPIGNKTTKYRIEQKLTSAITDEFIHRTKCRISSDPGDARGLLTGEVLDFASFPVIFAGDSGSTYQVTIRVRMTLKDQSTGKFIFQNRDFQFREEFEISRESSDYFPEEGPAMDRLVHQLARSMLDNLLDDFK